MYIKNILCILIHHTRCDYDIIMVALPCESIGGMHKPADAGVVRFTRKPTNRENYWEVNDV